MSDTLLRKLDDLKKNGELNAKDAKREDNLHRLFMYPGMMVPKTQTLIVDALTKYTPKPMGYGSIHGSWHLFVIVYGIWI